LRDTFITNKGLSSYNGLLATLSKNLSHGLQFDFNYTWSHSIDNTSLVANSIASSTGLGFVCEAQSPRVCRGNSDFDTTTVISSDFVYDLPFGRGRSFAASSPRWLDEVIGGWNLSGIPAWNSGVAFTTVSNAFVAGFAEDAPANRRGQVVKLLEAQIALVEANEGIAVIPSFGMLACRNRKVTMSTLIEPVVNLDFYQISNRGSRLSEDAKEFRGFL
jgi:DNA-binding transcriptional LysR family regulator